jgi:hypothetical protein
MSTTVPSKENYTLITESTTLTTTPDMTGLSPASDREQEIRDRRAAVPDAPWGVYRSLEGQYTVQAGTYVTLPEGFASTGDVAIVLGDDEESRYRRATSTTCSPWSTSSATGTPPWRRSSPARRAQFRVGGTTTVPAAEP